MFLLKTDKTILALNQEPSIVSDSSYNGRKDIQETPSAAHVSQLHYKKSQRLDQLKKG
ncbi:hypothetical protein BB14905_02795 [Bacillus sp. B14905]|nr:hypothetical protein BB14905_02795 [Bacillus sp. B14905]